MALSSTRRGVLGMVLAGLACRALPADAASLSLPARDDLVGRITEHVTDGERTLLEVAREHNIGVPMINAVNPGVDPWVPGAGKRLTLPTAHLIPDAPREGIVINMADLRLYFFPKVGPMQHYAIGVGKEGFNTPTGQTRIVRKRARPTWIPTKASLDEKPWLPRVVPPGPDNPLGDYAMDLGFPGFFLIHSTNKPYGVGRRVSHGCIRMYPEGMERLFPQVVMGSRVTVLEQFVKVGRHEGEFYLQVHPSYEQIDELEATYRMTPAPPPERVESLVAAKAGPDIARVDWELVAAEAAARRGLPVQITRPEPQQMVSEEQGGSLSGAGVPATPMPDRRTPSVGHGIY